jgi:hypothetical protein
VVAAGAPVVQVPSYIRFARNFGYFWTNLVVRLDWSLIWPLLLFVPWRTLVFYVCFIAILFFRVVSCVTGLISANPLSLIAIAYYSWRLPWARWYDLTHGCVAAYYQKPKVTFGVIHSTEFRPSPVPSDSQVALNFVKTLQLPFNLTPNHNEHPVAAYSRAFAENVTVQLATNAAVGHIHVCFVGASIARTSRWYRDYLECSIADGLILKTRSQWLQEQHPPGCLISAVTVLAPVVDNIDVSRSARERDCMLGSADAARFNVVHDKLQDVDLSTVDMLIFNHSAYYINEHDMAVAVRSVRFGGLVMVHDYHKCHDGEALNGEMRWATDPNNWTVSVTLKGNSCPYVHANPRYLAKHAIDDGTVAVNTLYCHEKLFFSVYHLLALQHGRLPVDLPHDPSVMPVPLPRRFVSWGLIKRLSRYTWLHWLLYRFESVSVDMQDYQNIAQQSIGKVFSMSQVLSAKNVAPKATAMQIAAMFYNAQKQPAQDAVNAAYYINQPVAVSRGVDVQLAVSSAPVASNAFAVFRRVLSLWSTKGPLIMLLTWVLSRVLSATTQSMPQGSSNPSPLQVAGVIHKTPMADLASLIVHAVCYRLGVFC